MASAIRRYDGTEFNGVLILNNTQFARGEVGKMGYTVVSANGDTYNITKIGLNDETYTIWDRIIITEGGVSSRSLNIGQNGTVWFRAIYEYDGEEFNGFRGRLWVVGSAMHWSENDHRWEQNYTSFSSNQIIFKISAVTDEVYHLKTFVDDAGPQTISWSSNFIISPLGLLIISFTIILFSAIIPILILKKLKIS